jgi:hypothetical protein
MDGLSYVALLILVLIASLIGVLIWFLGGLPGRVASQRDHPYTQAIQVGGWATLFLGVVGWPLVLMWAYAGPETVSRVRADNDGGLSDELERLKSQLDGLSKQIQKSGGDS